MILVLIILLRIFFLLVTQGSLVNDSISYNITLNSTLNPHKNPSWFSPSGLFAFGFYPQDDGFAVGIWLTTKPKITVVWTVYRDFSPFSSNSTIELTRDGFLFALTTYGEQNPIRYQFNLATSASILDSGNFVIYKHSEVVWQSFDYPTDTILGGQKVVAGRRLYSSVSASYHSSGRFVLYMQYDGNLVAYPRNSSMSSDDSYWSTETHSTYYDSLNLSRSGSLYMVGFDAPRRVLNPHPNVSVRNNETVIFRATLNPQGNFVLYSHIFTTPPSNLTRTKTEWAALTNPCKAKGICGVNSYCSSTTDDDAECHCFPGFSFLKDTIDGKILGCSRDFTNEEACSESGLEYFSYYMSALENIDLQALDDPYSVMNLSKNACSSSCLDDCKCWASLYADDVCKKFKDPIVNALLDRSISATVFIRAPQTDSVNIIKQSVVVERKRLVSVLAIAFGILALMCTLMAFSSFFFYRVHAHRYERVPDNVGFGLINDHLILRSFSFDELQKATDGFKEVIGRNSNREVYKGSISEGKKAVAVKRLEKVIEGGEFQAEIIAIAQTHHRNLVRLLGFCIHGATKLLVYEFMSNGSLADLLLAPPGWKERVRVALDVARGILYLHQECATRIIHCNIKPQNILFDDSWTAKISDFGLSKPLSPNQSGTLTSVRGTRGYLAPEWFKNTIISTKVDIYSFGVVLMEILCCASDMKIDILSEDKTPLITWVYNCFAANELNRLIGVVEDEEAVDIIYMCEKMVKVGLLCIQDDPEARPSIKDVILMLQETTDIPTPPSPTFLI